MTKTKSTKRALLSSALALLLCISMLIGSTFAWFTDSAVSGSNVIQSGKLDIVLEMKDANGNWVNAEGRKLEFQRAFTSYVGQEILWEPGCTFKLPEIRVRNNGNLAAMVVILINGIDGDAKLLEALEFTTTVDVSTANPAVKAWLAENGNTLTPIQADIGTVLWDEGLSPAGVTAGNGVTDTTASLTLAAHMKEEAGNEYQDLTIEGISITALATQTNYESDSFSDEYDKDAPYLNKDENGAWLLSSAADLVYFANTVNNGKNYKGEIVKLAADIDLAGINWAPINGFAGTFDGNGKTISNLTVTGTENVAFFSRVNTTAIIKNVTFDKATVTGNHYVAVVLGYETNNNTNAQLRNITVKNSAVTADTDAKDDNGDKVGGIVGYATTVLIDGCTVENTTITGYRDVGGIIGYASALSWGEKLTVTNNKVKNVTLICDNECNYKSYTTAEEHDINAVVGEATANAVVSGNAEENVRYAQMVAVSTSDALVAAIAGNTNVTVALENGKYTTNFKVAGGKDVVIEGNGKDTVLEGQIATTASNEGTLTLRNLTINVNSALKDSTGISQTGKSAIAVWGDQTVICENVTFNMALNESTAITSWWDTGVGTSIIVRNCTFNCNGQRPIRATGNITVENCTFNDPYRYAVQLTAKTSTADLMDKAIINFNNNTIIDGANGKELVYGLQLEGETYGCHDCVITGSGNTIVNGGEGSTMYFCECGKVDHDTVEWNTEVDAVHEQ